ncbi:hypothetical protein conserved [Leishmania donovani]|uniref:Hypothetical_protein_conserved n=1 Tax=Leishmania donovani TaxID=5661 RepID=A0A3S7WVT8_LEIDO|nr:hypothetical protein, conserved [Leishmania donovani]AYU78315.1 hypothetical protein LdCL_200008400 [Leishmania donovani]TPP45540.1 hypothetical protein CGC20_31885 [Leishmania donovani]TPP49959.1 hypothetical protein CGC21_29625 [Leishmania donovani]CAJ1988326.1 hypothetical protein conserved [Leishmania donovani]CBZ33669.1 hypothetical protein, conserved [Leishmania donovani]
MFEEALRQAPREELVEHIRLQRELIHRLHRRVLELESSLESVYTCSNDGGDAAGADGQSAAPSERQRAVLSSNLRHGPSPPIVQQSVHGVSGGAPPAKARTYPLATFCETPLGFSERWSTDNDEAAAAPEPRCRPPRPHIEEKAPVAFARLSSSLQRQTGEPAAMATSANGTDTAPEPFSAAAISTGLTSSSVDHPTVLEGIKEINYVLAAHRAGRPALPLPVVEELEDIRTRLLQGFKQTHSMGDRDNGTAHEAATARQAYGALPRGEEIMLNAGPSDLLFERRADNFRAATHVCPRWVSPDSSRVVYGTSPRRHQ